MLKVGNNYIVVIPYTNHVYISLVTVLRRASFDSWIELKIAIQGQMSLVPLEVGFKKIRFFDGGGATMNLSEDRVLLKKVLHGSICSDNYATKHLLKGFAARYHDQIFNAYVKQGGK